MLGGALHERVKIRQIDHWKRSESQQIPDHLARLGVACENRLNWRIAGSVTAGGLHDLSLPDIQRGNDATHWMKILIFEFVCGGGFQGAEPPDALLRQGLEMLNAALMDFSKHGRQVQVYTLVEKRFMQQAPPPIRLRHPEGPWNVAWRELVGYCDATLVIAPENDRQLEHLCAEVLRTGRQSLNCSLDAIRLTSDKLALNRHLQAAGLSAVETRGIDPTQPLPKTGVVKPRFGAGCEDTFRLDSGFPVPILDANEQWIWQPWLPGVAASFSLLVNRARAEILSCNKIHCEESEGQLQVNNTETGAMDHEAAFMEAGRGLVRQVKTAVPGLRGYAGIDVIWHEGEAVVLEINPRLTLTYVDQRRPLAMDMLRAFNEEETA